MEAWPRDQRRHMAWYNILNEAYVHYAIFDAQKVRHMLATRSCCLFPTSGRSSPASSPITP